MGDYVKYDELKEKVDRFKLTELGIDSRVRNDFYAHYNDLQSIREIEAVNGTLTEEEQSKKEAYMRAIDHWIISFIEDRRTTIEKDIDAFEKHVKMVIKKFEEIKTMFVLENIVNVDVNEIIKGIENDFNELIGEAEKLLGDIEELKELAKGYTEGLDFTVTYTGVKKRINELKDKLKTIKKDQIARYNAKVLATNAEINKMKEEFANVEGLSEDVRADLDNLQELNQCTAVVNKWDQIWHMTEEYMSYNKLKEMLLLLDQIRTKTKQPAPQEEVDLEADMKYIEDKLVGIENKIKDEMTMDEIKPLLDELTHVEGKITEFEIKLKENMKKISEEKYNEFVQRVETARNKLEELRKKIFERIPNLYKAFSMELESLNHDVSHLEFYVDALFGKITKDALSVYEERLNFYEGKLAEIKENIEKAKENGKLQDNQYAELKKRVDEIEKKLEKIRTKTKEPLIIKNTDIFEFLNGQIDGVEKELDSLELQIDSLEKPIKDRKVRKQIDAKIVRLETEIKDIEKFLEKYKDEDIDKYNATKERLDKVKERLNKISKKYRFKCPLLVRAAKSAKNFYKKHKKAVLIVAGLAALALVGYHVLIPAIMHGNIMISSTTPALRPFMKFINNVLGGVIGATRTTDGLWILKSGVIINPLSGSSSLLKGLAVSGISTATLVTPLVFSIKKLIEKMRKTELKNKIDEVKEKTKKEKKPKDNTKKNNKKASRTATDYFANLWKEYEKSGKSIDEFCTDNELSEDDKAILNIINNKKQEELEKNNGRGGKR